MPSPRTRWTLAIGGGLFVGLTIVAAFVLAATTTTTSVTIIAGNGGSAAMGSRCEFAIEAAGAPDGVWNGTLTDGMRFQIPVPEGLGTSIGYRIEALGDLSFSPPSDPELSPLQPTPRSSVTMCMARNEGEWRSLGEYVARGHGTLYAAFWSFTAP